MFSFIVTSHSPAFIVWLSPVSRQIRQLSPAVLKLSAKCRSPYFGLIFVAAKVGNRVNFKVGALGVCSSRISILSGDKVVIVNVYGIEGASSMYSMPVIYC